MCAALPFVRHVVGTGPLSQSALDARMGAVGATKHVFEERQGAEHPRLVLYRLPADEAPDPAQNGSIPSSQSIPDTHARGKG